MQHPSGQDSRKGTSSCFVLLKRLHGSARRCEGVHVLRPGAWGSYQGKLPPARSLACAAQGGQLQGERHRIKADRYGTVAAVRVRQSVLHIMLCCAVGVHPEAKHTQLRPRCLAPCMSEKVEVQRASNGNNLPLTRQEVICQVNSVENSGSFEAQACIEGARWMTPGLG